MVPKTELCVGLCADSAEPAWDSLSPSLSAPPQLVLVHMRMLALSLSQKLINIKKKSAFLLVS